MSKSRSNMESIRWRPAETTELDKYLRSHTSIHTPTYVGFWSSCKLVKSGARSAQSCKLKYLQLAKKNPSAYSRSKSEPTYASQTYTDSATTTAGMKTELALTQEKTKVEKETKSTCVTTTANTEEEEEDSEIQITAIIPPKKLSWSQPKLKYQVAASSNAKMEPMSEATTNEEDDGFDEASTENGASLVSLKAEQKSTQVQSQICVKKDTNVLQKVVKFGNKLNQGETDSVENIPRIKNDTSVAVFQMNSIQFKNYCTMYRKIKSQSSCENRNVQLMAENIDGIVEMVYKLLGNREDSTKEEMLLKIFQPDKQQFGDNGNIIRLLVYNIFSCYTHINFIEKLASVGLTLTNLQPGAAVGDTKGNPTSIGTLQTSSKIDNLPPALQPHVKAKRTLPNAVTHDLLNSNGKRCKKEQKEETRFASTVDFDNLKSDGICAKKNEKFLSPTNKLQNEESTDGISGIIETSGVAMLDQVGEEVEVAGENPEAEISSRITSAAKVKEQFLCNTENVEHQQGYESMVNVFVTSLIISYGQHKDSGNKKQQLMKVLGKTNDMFGYFGAPLLRNASYTYMTVEQVSRSTVFVEANKFSKDVVKKKLQIEIGETMANMVEVGDVIVANDICYRSTKSKKVVLFNPSWNLTEVALFKLNYEGFMERCSKESFKLAGSMNGVYLCNHDIHFNYIWANILMSNLENQIEMHQLIRATETNSKFLLRFWNPFNNQFLLRYTQTQAANDSDLLTPLFKSHLEYVVEPSAVHNFYLEYEMQELKRNERMTIEFSAIFKNKPAKIFCEIVFPIHHE